MQPTNADLAQLAALAIILRLDAALGFDERERRQVAGAAENAARLAVGRILEHRRMLLCLAAARDGRLSSTHAARLHRLTRRLSPERWARACRRFVAVAQAREARP